MLDRDGRSRRRAPTHWRLGLLSLLALAAMFTAVIANAFAATSHRREAEAWHLHTLDVLLVVGELRATLNEARRRQRDYLLTGDRLFVKPYSAARQRTLALSARLGSLTRENPAQQHNIAILRHRVADYIRKLDRLVALDAQGDHDTAFKLMRATPYLNLGSELLTMLDQVEREERHLLQLRRAANEAADAQLELYDYALAGTGALLLILLAMAGAAAGRAHRHALDLADELRSLATTDPLTGLPNRRQLTGAIEMEISRSQRTGRPLALALLDVDRFKSINDSYGHPAGDAVLRTIADTLRRVIREGDILGRFGGEEFLVLMPGTTGDEARMACERLRAAIAEAPIPLPGGSCIAVTLSAGFARMSGDEYFDQLISRADAALYEAKSRGRNLVRMAA